MRPSLLRLHLLSLIAGLGCTAEMPDEPGGSPDAGAIVEQHTGGADDVYASQHNVNCSDTLDDAPALRTLISETRHAGGLGHRIIMPAGRCIIGSTVMFRGVAGATLRGQGAMATTFEWRGNNSTPMFVLENTNRQKLEDFAIETATNKPLKVAIQIRNGGPCLQTETNCLYWSSSQATIRDVAIRGNGRLTDGVHVAIGDRDGDNIFEAEDDVKNDLHRFENVSVENYTGAGFVLDGLNAKALALQNCSCSAPDGNSCVTTNRVADAGASFYWYGGMTAGHDVADFNLGHPVDAIVISGVNSTGSNRFLLAQDAGSQANGPEYPVTVEGVQFDASALPADAEAIRFYLSGPLTVTGSRWGTRTQMTPVSFRYSPGSNPSAFVFTGNFVGGNNTDKFAALDPTELSSNLLVVAP